MSASERHAVVRVANTNAIFTSYVQLERQAEDLRRYIVEIERHWIAKEPHNVEAWSTLERTADDLLSILTAMEDWLILDASELDSQIESTCALIRKL